MSDDQNSKLLAALAADYETVSYRLDEQSFSEDMVSRDLYEEQKKLAADAMVLVSDLRQNLTEAVEKNQDLTTDNDLLEDVSRNLKRIVFDQEKSIQALAAERDTLKARNAQLLVAIVVLGLIAVIQVIV